MNKPVTTRQMLIILLAVSAIVRALIAGFFELGNDEVYYWTYAVYPDLSHFDHPPMVGWLIRLFTFNLHFQEEFFLRLASIVTGTLNTWIIYLIGKKIKDELTGWYSALLYTASIYGFVITGVFILPDTPQTLFWLLALLLMLEILPNQNFNRNTRLKMLLLGIALGVGLLSKYTTAFLWFGTLLFIISSNRSWVRKWSFYAANLLMAGIFSIVFVWNALNEFISFRYQGGRAGISDLGISIDSFLTELGGEILYNNPVNFILLFFALITVFRSRKMLGNPHILILLFSGLPLIGTFLILSLFRGTLPHWSGPGYMTLIPIIALTIRLKKPEQQKNFPVQVIMAVALLMLITGISMLQIKTGFIHLFPSDEKENTLGKRDYSLEVYGWKQLGEKFDSLASSYEISGEIKPGSPIVTYRWFPAANLEYYVAKPSGRFVLACGELDEIHKYAWINRIHGGFQLNSDAWYITSSRDFRAPRLLAPLYYKKVMPADIIHVVRNGKTAYYFYVYRMINLQSKPTDILEKTNHQFPDLGGNTLRLQDEVINTWR